MERTGEVVPVADPGFPRGAPPEREGAPTYYLAKICRRVHANEENWTGGGAGEASKILLLRSVTG